MSIIDSLFCGKIFFARLPEGLIINGDIEQLAYSAREFRKVNEGVVCLKGNLGVLILVVSLLSLKV